MNGYKVFNSNFKCRDFQFAENTEFEISGDPVMCQSGFHFCVKANHCFNYYTFDSQNIVCEVEAIGTIVHDEKGEKSCTNKIRIGRRLTWEEVLFVSNSGLNNTGHSNTGDRNTGDRNTGYSNTGDRNTGDWNTGDRNTGDRNTGDRNTGYSNTGDRNTGYRNTGDWNTGYRNTGDWNTGDRNTGDRNTGDRNTGDRNTGYRNTGDRNTGDWNTGDRNTGYSNTGDRNTGVFCTGEPFMQFFNQSSDWTEEKFRDSTAFSLLCNDVYTKQWVPSSHMTDEEKTTHPSYLTCEGYLKDIPFKEAFTNAWGNWSSKNREAFTSLPNFDSAIFETITGVKI